MRLSGLLASPLLACCFGWAFYFAFQGYCHISLARRREVASASAECTFAPGVPQAVFSAVAAIFLTILLIKLQPSLALAWVLPQLLALVALTLAISHFRSWHHMNLLAPLMAAAVYMAYFANVQAQSVLSLTFAWALAAMLLGSVVLGLARVRLSVAIAQVQVVAAGLLMVVLMLAMDLSLRALAFQVMLVSALTLALCLHYRWHYLRVVAYAWLAMALAIQAGTHLADASAHPLAWTGWIWTMWTMLTADIQLRAWLRRFATDEHLDALLAGYLNALLFASTYHLLRPLYVDWLGLYVACLGVAAGAAAWLVRRRANRRPLGYAYLTSSLVLLAWAVPIQFRQMNVTLGWAIQAVVLMLAARRLRNPLTALASALVLLAGLVHHVYFSLPGDPAMGQVVLQLAGVDLTAGLMMTLVLTAAAFIVAAVVGYRPFMPERFSPIQMSLLIASAGIAIYFAHTLLALPALAATWWWLTLTFLIGASAIICRSRRQGLIVGGMLLLTVAKWLVFDTLTRQLLLGIEGGYVILNWQFAAAPLLMVALGIYAHRFLRSGLVSFSSSGTPANSLAVAFELLAAAVGVWAGSFEIHRFFASALSSSVARPDQALQMGLSVWWAVSATALLVLGFARMRLSFRYAAIALFGLTTAKVFLVDLYDVEAMYRIVSFLILGLLLLGAAWVYSSYFRARARAAGSTASSGGKTI